MLGLYRLSYLLAEIDHPGARVHDPSKLFRNVMVYCFRSDILSEPPIVLKVLKGNFLLTDPIF